MSESAKAEKMVDPKEVLAAPAPKRRRATSGKKVVKSSPPAAEVDKPGVAGPLAAVPAADDDKEAGEDAPTKRGRRKKSDLKQRAILEAAAKVFKNKGYARATLSEIGKKAGTFAGSMYYHFDSKEDLVEEVLNLGTTGVAGVVAKAVAALPENATHRTRILTAFRAHLNQMLLRDDFIVAYWRIIDQVPAEVRARHLKKPREYGNFWRDLIADAVAAGEIKPSIQQTILRLVLVGTSIYALDWYSPRGEMDADDIAEAVIDMIFDGVQGPTSTSS